MTVGQAIVLGIVQGLTEFLPISSTAHLRIIPALCGWPDPGAAFTAVIQLGTLAAVLSYFARDIITITRDTITGRGRLGWMIVVGTLPVVVCGLIFKDNVEHTLRSLYVMAGAMIALALVLAVAEWCEYRRRRLRVMADVGWLDAVVVGCAQAVALIPGSSRSGCTIAGALFMGLNREAAARFSFLLSLPAIAMAGVYEFISHRHDLLSSDASTANVIIATAVSAVVGYLSIAFLLNWLKRHTMWLFIIYRLVLGALLLALLQTGKLPAQ